MKKLPLFIFTLSILSGLTFVFFLFLFEIFLPKDSLSLEEKVFVVEKGESLFQVAESLENEGLIKNRFFFIFYLVLKGDHKKIKAGKFLLSPSMSIPEISKILVLGKTLKIKLTFPEGFTQNQIAQILLEKGVTKEDITKFKIKDFQNEFFFLKDAPGENSLEGFLFPDTYFFEPEMEAKKIIVLFLKNFEKKTLPLLKEAMAKNQRIYDVLILASLLEKEVKTLEEKKLVSGILQKRLKNGIPLQVDATIGYITGKKTTKFSLEDLQIDSPYNTYKYLGLPPGPICNPGLESILAVLYPQESDYWYYLSTPDGQTHFSKTLMEHNIKKAKYLQ